MLVRHQQRNYLYLCIAGKRREYYRTERESYGVRRDIHFIGDIFRESLIPGKFAHFIRLFGQQVKALPPQSKQWRYCNCTEYTKRAHPVIPF